MYGTWSTSDGTDTQIWFSEINTRMHKEKHNHTSMPSTTLNFESLTVIWFDSLAKTSLNQNHSKKKGNFTEFWLISFTPSSWIAYDSTASAGHRDTINIKLPIKVNYTLICKCYNTSWLLRYKGNILYSCTRQYHTAVTDTAAKFTFKNIIHSLLQIK